MNATTAANASIIWTASKPYTVIHSYGERFYATKEEAVAVALRDKLHACGPRGWLVRAGKLV